MKKAEKNKKRSSAHLRPEAAPTGSGNGSAAPTCDPHCARFAACRPDSPGWVLKKQVATNLGTTRSALRQRALRIAYVSPVLNAMPRRDQPKLCLDAAYFALQAQARPRKRR